MGGIIIISQFCLWLLPFAWQITHLGRNPFLAVFEDSHKYNSPGLTLYVAVITNSSFVRHISNSNLCCRYQNKILWRRTNLFDSTKRHSHKKHIITRYYTYTYLHMHCIPTLVKKKKILLQFEPNISVTKLLFYHVFLITLIQVFYVFV